MSERIKLEQSWKERLSNGEKLTAQDMVIEVGKLVEKCPHNKTHWVQEINREGEFSNKLFKRCFLCGFNIDELDVEPEFLEHVLANFDVSCEAKKLGTYTQHGKQAFCPWCGAGLISKKRFWFLYSPLYTLHLFRCARPHGISWFLVGYDANKRVHVENGDNDASR